MKRIITIVFLFVSLNAGAQILCNGWRYVTGGGSYPTTLLRYAGLGTNVIQSSNAISALPDANGGGVLPSQATAGNKPTWVTSNTIRSDGTTDYLSGAYTLSYPINIYVRLFSSTAANGAGYQPIMFIGDRSNGGFGLTINAGKIIIEAIATNGSGAGTPTFSASLANSTWYTVHAEITNATTGTIEVVGLTGTMSGSMTIGTPGTNILTICAALNSGAYYAGLAGDIKALFIYGSQSGTDIANTKTFLNGL